MAFSKDNPPADTDYSPEAMTFRTQNEEAPQHQPTPNEGEDGAVPTNHELHGGAIALTKDQKEEEPGAEPAPRHYDGE